MDPQRKIIYRAGTLILGLGGLGVMIFALMRNITPHGVLAIVGVGFFLTAILFGLRQEN